MAELKLIQGQANNVASQTNSESTNIGLAELKEENKMLRNQLANLVLDLSALMDGQALGKLLSRP